VTERQQLDILLETLAVPLLAALLYGKLHGRNRWIVTACSSLALLCNALRRELLSPDHWTGFCVTYVCFWVLYFVWAKWLRERYWVLTVVFVLPGMCLFLLGLLFASFPHQT
jgi:drug/metabolite transporter (DMT)-like permease